MIRQTAAAAAAAATTADASWRNDTDDLHDGN